MSAAPEQITVRTPTLDKPTWAPDDAPDPYTAKTVFACGDWSVLAADGGWYDWAPNSEEERATASAC